MQPRHLDDPHTVGPFHVRGRLADHRAGVVLLGYDEDGRAAAIAMLHSAAADDPAARDRLAGQAEELARTEPGVVLARGPQERLTWVATAYSDASDGAPAAALGLLDGAALADADPADGLGAAPAAGPDFAPYWQKDAAAAASSPGVATPDAKDRPDAEGTPASRGTPARSPSAGSWPPPANSRRSLLILAGCVLGVTVLLAGVWWLLSSFEDPSDDLRAEPTASDPSDIPGYLEPEASDGPTPGTEPTWSGQDGPPGPVAGPTYGDGEPTYLMDLTENGFPFDFRAPGSWGCMKASVDGRPEVEAWVCMDESGIFGGEAPEVRSRAEIWVEPCPRPCGSAEWREVRSDGLDHPEGLDATDATTRYGVRVLAPGERVHLTMSHLFGGEDGRPTRHLGVEVTGAAGDMTTMQKLINELRTRAG